MRKLIVTATALSLCAACTIHDSEPTEVDSARVYYKDTIDRLQLPSADYKLVDVKVAHEYRDLDDLDAASFAAEYAFTPSPGVLREQDENVTNGPVYMSWGEQFGWPIKPSWKPGRLMPSIAVLDVVAEVNGERVTYQSLLIKDFPQPGDPEGLSDPVLDKLHYAAGPQFRTTEFVADTAAPPTDLGIKVDPGVDQIACNTEKNKEEVKWASGEYLAHCGTASDKLQVKFAVHGNVYLKCGAPAADGSCLPTSYAYLDNFVGKWRVCDDDKAGLDASARDCSGWYSTRSGDWSDIAGSTNAVDLQVSWALCDNDVAKIKIEKGTAKAFITRSKDATDTVAIGYAGISASQQLVTQIGNWTALPLVKIATAMTIAYYGSGTLFSTLKFLGWLLKFGAEEDATSRLGPTTVSLGLTCPSAPAPAVTPTKVTTTTMPTTTPTPTPPTPTPTTPTPNPMPTPTTPTPTPMPM
jgi:hypothetical protein